MWPDRPGFWTIKCERGRVSDLLDRGRSVQYIFIFKYFKISRLLGFDMIWPFIQSTENCIQKAPINASSRLKVRILIMNMREENSQEHPVCETADLPSSVVSSCQHLWQRQPEPQTALLHPPASGKLSLLLGWGSFLAPRLHLCQTATQSWARTVEKITT